MTYHYNLKSLFIEIADKHAGQTALHFEDVDVTYKELYERAEDIAAALQQKNVRSGAVIGIISHKDVHDYAAMIACLLCGITYTNIDPENPKKRAKNIIESCRPEILLTSQQDEKFIELANENNIELLYYSEIDTNKAFDSDQDPDGETLAYIMFTSGSTGIPKGVAVTHQNLLHFIEWTTSRYEVTSKDNFANISPMYFDNSVFDFFTALFSGASLTPISRELLQDPLALVNYIDRKDCTIWFSVPSMLIYLLTMRVLTKDVFKNIRVFTFGGEGFPKTELKKLYDLYADGAKIINVYGPTEGTCICSSYDITEDDFKDLDELASLGTINPNFSFVILDGDKPAQEGELCILGPNIAKGYYNDPERSAPVFQTYTDNIHYRKNMYRTGDLVEERNGLLYFKGRADNQIKHMGYRIELEEIELALNALEEVRQAVVIYKRSEAAFGKIIAFLTPENADVDIAKVKSQISEKLPSYMLPSVYEVLEELPKNANGKVDRKQLKALVA